MIAGIGELYMNTRVRLIVKLYPRIYTYLKFVATPPFYFPFTTIALHPVGICGIAVFAAPPNPIITFSVLLSAIIFNQYLNAAIWDRVKTAPSNGWYLALKVEWKLAFFLPALIWWNIPGKLTNPYFTFVQIIIHTGEVETSDPTAHIWFAPCDSGYLSFHEHRLEYLCLIARQGW
jgi:hypothetical protein